MTEKDLILQILWIIL